MAHERDPGGHGIHPMKRVGIPKCHGEGSGMGGAGKGGNE